MDGKLAALAESRSNKDEEMKGLERTLVQVLVEQQKKLLTLLSEVRKCIQAETCGISTLSNDRVAVVPA